MGENIREMEELETLDGIIPVSNEWTYFYEFTADSDSRDRPRYTRFRKGHEYKKIKHDDVTEIWRRLKR